MLACRLILVTRQSEFAVAPFEIINRAAKLGTQQDEYWIARDGWVPFFNDVKVARCTPGHFNRCFNFLCIHFNSFV